MAAQTREQILAQDPNAKFGPSITLNTLIPGTESYQKPNAPNAYGIGDWVDMGDGTFTQATKINDDFGETLLMAGLSAGIGALSGGFGLNDLVSSFGGTGIDSGSLVDAADNFYSPDVSTVSEGSTNLSGGPAADTLGEGPAVTGTAEAPASATESLSKNLIDADSIVPPTGSGASGELTTAAENAVTQGAGASGNGLINNLLNNRTALTIGGQVLSGALRGAGSASLSKAHDERVLAANKELIADRLAQQLAQSRAGTYAGGTGVSPSGQRILYRPDGTPVFVNGIINTAMNR